jgi:hypothetical protein
VNLKLRSFIPCGSILIVLIAASSAISQSLQISDFLEFSYHDCASKIGCRSGVIQVHADGRYVAVDELYEASPSGNARRVKTTVERLLEKEELAELQALAEELFSAGPEYIVKKGRRDPAHVTITYRHRRRETRITVIDFNLGDATAKSKVPPPVLKLMRWARPEAYP